MLDIGIMGLLRMRMDALHYALLAVVVLLAVYAFGSFKEGAATPQSKPWRSIVRSVDNMVNL